MRDFVKVINESYMLMEGALVERIKRECKASLDEEIMLASGVYNEEIRSATKRFLLEYINIAKEKNLPIMITTPTRRANKERVEKSKYKDRDIIRDNIRFLKEIRNEVTSEVYIGGLMGCIGDAYEGKGLSEEESYKFHLRTVNKFKEEGVDFLFAGIMPEKNEAVGMARAMESSGIPYIISFMIRNDGCLLDGATIKDVIALIDSKTGRNPIGYMVNCVHPKILDAALSKNFNNCEEVRNRFLGIQGNTAMLSPEELNNSKELILSPVDEWVFDMKRLKDNYKLRILGGCCGTDDKYMKELSEIF